MKKDTLITIKDSIQKIELILPDNPAEKIMGLPSELASILIPVVITILIFGLGLFFQWRSKKKDKLIKLRSFKTLIVEWSKLTKNTITLQQQLYSKFRFELSNQKDILPVSIYHEPFLIDRLDNLDLEKLIELVIINSKGDKKENSLILLNVVTGIHKLSNIENQVIKKYDEFLDYTWSLNETWNTHFKVIKDFGFILPHKISGCDNASEKEFYDKLFEIFNDFSKLKPEQNTTEATIETFIKPLSIICSKAVNSHKSIEEIFMLKSTLVDLNLLWNKWLGYKNGVLRYFQETESNIQQSVDFLNENIKIFENLSLYNWTKIK